MDTKITPTADNVKEEKKENSEIALLYIKKVTCPVCAHTFDASVVKSSAYRITKKDSDFFIKYSLINPYFYDVWVCNSCGYAAMKTDFNSLRIAEIDQVKKSISPKWRARTYPDIYDVNIAIERYKLSLLNYVVINAKSSKKAINCLKLAWMYRLMNTPEAVEIELKFLNQALVGLNDAYYSEPFPLCGMDKYSVMYLIGELNRRTGHPADSLIWFSNVITTPNVKQSLKELARDMKDLIKAEDKKVEITLLAASESANKSSTENTIVQENVKKAGLFSKFFK